MNKVRILVALDTNFASKAQEKIETEEIVREVETALFRFHCQLHYQPTYTDGMVYGAQAMG